MELSKVLIIGATGAIGKYLVNASVKLGHKTFAFVRSTTPSDSAKAELLKSFQDAGVTLLVGDVADYASLVAALKQVEVVISSVSAGQVLDQIKIIDAAKEAGTIKRFIPSEFGSNRDRLDLDNAVMKAIFGPKLVVRALSKRKLIIFGDGNTKAVWNDEVDIATFTIRSVDDPRAANKNLLIKGNLASLNEVIALWEKKIGHKFEKEFLNNETVLKLLAELTPPKSIHYGLNYSAFIKDNRGFELDPSTEVEATALYPDVKYTTIDEYLSRFL